MKLTKMYGAVVAMLGMVASAQAGSIVLTSHSCCGAEKSCGCAPACQPKCCRPVICKPSCPNVYNYQRSCAKTCGCCPAATCAPKCCPAPATCAAPVCAPAPATCAAPVCAPAPATCAAPCAPAPATCAAPCAPKCAPAPATCAAPCAPAPATCAAPASCAAPAPAKCCDTPCQKTCCADPCEVAHWIYESQTACHGKCRKKAIKKLGKFDCVCNPEIMCAFIYGLNDTDERVRRESARQIRKQVKCNGCCCNCKVVAALTCALADCDKKVVRAATRALRCCGYDVQDCCQTASCGTCAPASCSAPVHTETVPAAPAEGGEAAPAPAPAPASAEPEAYFPSRLKSQQTKAHKSGLSNLFGMRG